MSWSEVVAKLPKDALGYVAIVATLTLFVGVALVGIQMWRGDALICADGSFFAKSCTPQGVALSGAIDERLPGAIDERLPGAIDERLPGAIDERLPGAMENYVDGRVTEVVANRVDEVIDGRVTEVVEEYLAEQPPVVVAGNGALPRNTVIMTDQECTSLGGWVPYSRAAGRLPIGAGSGVDINGVGRVYNLNEDDPVGEYEHLLTVEEMPAHTHQHNVGGSGGRHRCGGDCNNLGGSRATGSTGESLAHNNMPPTFTVSFCIQAGGT